MKSLILIKKLLLPLRLYLLGGMLGLLCYVSPASAQLAIPNPRGYVEVSSQSQEVLKIATAGMPPSQQLIGFYFTTNAAQQVISTGYASNSPFCKAVIYKSLGSDSEARRAFKDLLKSVKNEIPADRNQDEVNQVFQHYEEAAKKLNEGVEVKVLGVEFLGSFIETKNIYGFSMLASYARKENGHVFNMPLVLADVWMLGSKQILQFTVAFPLRSIDDVENSRNELLVWIEDIQKRPRTPEQKQGEVKADALFSLQEASRSLDIWVRDKVTPVVLVEPSVGGFAPKEGSSVGNTWSKSEVKAVVLVKPGIAGYEPVSGSYVGNTWSKSDVLPVVIVTPSVEGFASYLTSSGLAVQGGSHALSASASGGKSYVVETTIKGAFKGWDGNTVIELTNGQIWKQSEYYYEYYYAYQPSVMIYPDGGGFKMKVEGVSKSVGVSRLK